MATQPKFTKRSYGIVAEVLRSVKPIQDEENYEIAMAQWEQTCLAFLNHFRQDNPAYDAQRFLKACKGEAS